MYQEYSIGPYRKPLPASAVEHLVSLHLFEISSIQSITSMFTIILACTLACIPILGGPIGTTGQAKSIHSRAGKLAVCVV